MRARNSSAFWLSGRDRALLPRSPKNRTREFPAYGFLKIVLAEQSFIRLHVAQCCFFPVASYDHFEGITRFDECVRLYLATARPQVPNKAFSRVFWPLLMERWETKRLQARHSSRDDLGDHAISPA